MATIPRGIRNHNPGNIDRTTERWQGMATDQSSDPRFVVFTGPVWGLRALAKVLLSYQRKYNLRTPAAIIGRWAPPVENDTGAYARQVAKALGVQPGDQIDLQDARTLERILPAIVAHENGHQPYPEALIRQAVTLALE
ncbi:structural protein P5 [Xylophilus sp. Leaf220]|uniref:structural protein P5 n=1 Tax=Xylophilus sp. Leaf220 TaxID=1735686 RepID=UPI0006F28437|nr:structural protein P5 [Xylophilus sp. Leaf220]KQM78921.1 structural protein P5 [Xylophilus sp. Leaf220]